MPPAELGARGLLRRDVSLAELTTYKFGGPARWFAEPRSEEEVSEVLAAAHRLGIPVVVLGRGSNVVVSDRGLDAVVIRLAGDFATLSIDAAGVVDAGAAVPLPKLARFSVEHGRGGLEWYVGIPGSVGGAVRMNAGCFGSETGDCMIDARILDMASGAIATRTPEDLAMAYRRTDVGPEDVILSARFRTTAQAEEEGRSRMREITAWRKRTQPGGTLNAGSVFKNPPGDAAGRVIDALGLKGFAIGGVRVSPRHANFFEAGPDATAQDVYDLVALVRRRVAEATGVDLEPEVQFLGDFAPAPRRGGGG